MLNVLHTDVEIASARVEVNLMKSSIGNSALRLVATAFLFAPVAAAQAPGSSQSVCKYVWDPVLFKPLRVCNEVYYPPPPPPPQPAVAAEPPVQRTTGGERETIPYDPVNEARKAQLRATEHRVPPSSS